MSGDFLSALCETDKGVLFVRQVIEGQRLWTLPQIQVQRDQGDLDGFVLHAETELFYRFGIEFVEEIALAKQERPGGFHYTLMGKSQGDFKPLKIHEDFVFVAQDGFQPVPMETFAENALTTYRKAL